MKNRISKLIWAALLSLILTSGFANDSIVNQYQKLIIFGDSYSDNGNVYQLTQEAIPNSLLYYQGRFSNGPAWAEYFAGYFNIDPGDRNKFIDMAYGGARILQPVKEKIHGNPLKFYIVPNLSQQIDTYLEKYGVFSPEDLIVVFIGTNDYAPLFHNHPNTFFTHLANLETVQINRLIQSGAQQIIVFNIRNLTYVPFIEFLNSKKYFPLNIADRYYRQYLDKSILTFNSRLEKNLKNKPKIFIYDIFKFDNVIFSNIKKNGYSYSMDNQNYNLQYGSIPCYKNYKNDYQHIVGAVCKNSQEYFFYDRIHTTAAVNFLLAEDVYRQFSNKK